MRAFAITLKPDESAGIYVAMDETHRIIKLKFMQLATHRFSQTAIQEYRSLVKSLKSEFTPNHVIADPQTRQGQTLLVDQQ